MSVQFAPYQIDFSAIAAGKRVSATKRKMRWRFGYANPQALKDGRNGTDCRGEEHDVTIVWSITSGKRNITMDGKEVHYSTNRAGTLEFSWQAKGNHVIKVLCHAAPPMTAEPGFRQYDLSIDGQSFFTMPKVFQLGVNGAVSEAKPGSYRNNYASSNTGYSPQTLHGDAPTTRQQEQADLRAAIQASISESRHHLGESTGRNDQSSDLLGFAGPPAASAPPVSDARSVASYYSAPTTYGQSFASPPPPAYPAATAAPSVAAGAIVPAVAPPGYYQAPPPAAPTYAASHVPPSYAAPAPISPAYTSPLPPQQASFSSPPPVPPAPHPTPTGDVFGIHSAPMADPFAPKPVTQQDLTNAILASYQAPPQGAPQTPMANNAGAPTTPRNNPAANGGVTLSMNNLALTTGDEKPKSPFEKALCNLVNIDHIDEPAYGENKLTMMKKEEAKKKVVNGKSVPLPPSGAGVAGTNAPLSQIKKDFEQPQNNTTEGIMNAPPPGAFHPNAAHGGALVVHGQGPPPLQQASGFGVGQMLPNGGFQKQQNLAPGYMQQQQKLHY
jgi:hypothetical protein